MATSATALQELIYVDDSMPGIARRRAGRGFAYYDPKGTLIRDRAEKQRLNAIALPPAYVDEWFCPAANGHILATGYDAKGRKQYRYHPRFRTIRESEKFDSCAEFGSLLPLVRKRVADDLRSPSLGQDKAVAALVRLLDMSAIRVGNSHYAKNNESYGATTLLPEHAAVKGHSVQLNFIGKGGKERDVILSDASLARVVRRMQDLNGQELFAWVGEDGSPQDVNSGHVNDYLRETLGADFTAKHFRTWHASVMAYSRISDADDNLTIKSVIEAVADHLGNTPAVTRKSYIHPAVIDLVDRQAEWRSNLRLPRSTQWLNRHERGLLQLLEKAPKAEELLVAA